MLSIFTIRNLIFVSTLAVSSAVIAAGQAAESCKPSVIGGVELICIERGVGSFSSIDRARAIADRVQKLSATQTFDPDKIGVLEQEASSDVTADDQVLVSIRDEDVVPKGSATRHEFAKETVDKMKAAIIKERAERSPQELIHGLVFTALATLGLFIFLKLASKFYQALYLFIRNNTERYIPGLRIKTFEVLSSRRLADLIVWLAQVSRLLTTLTAFYLYLPLVLSFFPATSNFAPKIYGYVVDPLKSMLVVFIEYIPKLFFLAILTGLTRYFLRIVHFFFIEIENETISFEGFYKEWAEPTYKLVRILIIAFAIVVAFPYIPGSSSPAFQGISVFLGILVSLGSSSAIGNIVAGIVLTYMRPFRIGDRVKIADTVGDVLEKTLLVTKILTIKNIDITIPNSLILGSHISNYSTMANEKGLIIHTTVTIGYDVPWKQVHGLLLEAADKTADLEKTPPPFVLQTSLDDFYVSYQINAYTKVARVMARISSDLHRNIQDCFNASGVEIMSPHYSALRDGNEVTVPAGDRSSDYAIPAFRIGFKPE